MVAPGSLSPSSVSNALGRLSLRRMAMAATFRAVLVLLFVLPAAAQSPTFEAISIKPARSGDPRNMRMRVLPNGDLVTSAVPVSLLLRYAYDVPINPSPRLAGAPEWRETFDI